MEGCKAYLKTKASWLYEYKERGGGGGDGVGREGGAEGRGEE